MKNQDMNKRRFKRAAQLNRTKAIFLTIVFHIVLIGGIAIATGADWKQYMPDFLKVETVETPPAESPA
jgi:hypothetical protein